MTLVEYEAETLNRLLLVPGGQPRWRSRSLRAIAPHGTHDLTQAGQVTFGDEVRRHRRLKDVIMLCVAASAAPVPAPPPDTVISRARASASLLGPKS